MRYQNAVLIRLGIVVISPTAAVENIAMIEAPGRKLTYSRAE